MKDSDGTQETEWLLASEIAKRMGPPVNRMKVGTWARSGKISKGTDSKYPWPLVRDEIRKVLNSNKVIDPDKRAKAPQVEQARIEVQPEEAIKLSASEMVLQELQRGMEGADGRAYQWARAMNEVLKVRKDQLKILEMEGKTVSRQEAENRMFTVSRQNRDIWLNWPQVVAVEMAEELGIDAKAMHDILKKHVRKNLERIASMPVGVVDEDG